MKRLKATTTIGSAAHAPAPIRSELQLKQLRPYVSVILYDLRAWRDHSEDLVDEVEDRIEATISSTHKQGDRLKDYGPIAKITLHRWITRGRWHSVQTVPSWMAEVKAESIPHEDHGSEGGNQEPIEDSLRDVRHHLTLFLAKNGAAPDPDSFGILLSTDPGIRREVADYLDVLGVPQVPEAELASAFLRGASRQAWLKGVHKPIVVKADAKTLVGLDLRNVLDPFGDQSFRLEAAISDHRTMRIIDDYRDSLGTDSHLRDLDPLDAIGLPPKKRSKLIGLSMTSGVLWTRSTRKITDFIEEIDGLCDQLSRARQETTSVESGYEQQGYRILARAQSASLAALGSAIDFSLDIPLPGEEPDPNIPEPILEAQHLWQEHGEFIARRNEIERLWVDAYLDGKKIAELRVQPVLLSGGVADLNLSVLYAPGAGNSERETLDYLLLRFADHASLWFSNGFSIQNKRLFALTYRDVPFEKWRWLPFSDTVKKPFKIEYDLHEEKPAQAGLWKVSWNSNSLFEFVLNNLDLLFSPSDSAYLFCDDGSGEIADFVFIDPGRNKLRLVHVKAAGEASKREIAPAKYEQVISQATKNLRFLDVTHLIQRLGRERTESGATDLTWNAKGEPSAFEDAIKALQGLGKFPDRGVVVLQPHTTRGTWEKAEQSLRDEKLGEDDRVQLFRLRTMLADFDDVCRRFGASFEAWGVNDLDDDLDFARASLRPPVSNRPAISGTAAISR
jgi:hypothetical protein